MAPRVAVVLVPLVLLLPLISLGNTAFLYDSTGIVRPKNAYAFIGETLTLTCNVTDPGISGNVSGRMYFTKRIDNVERIISHRHIKLLNTRSIRLEYPVKSGRHQGTYTCHLNRTDESNLVLGSQYVTVDHRPREVDRVNCSVYNWETLTCTWNLEQYYVNPDLVRVQLVWAIQGSQYDCPHQNRTSCTWRLRDGNDTFQPGKTYYMCVIVTTHNKQNKTMDEAQSRTFDIDTRLLVKPAPVYNLTVTGVNSTCISLKWRHVRRNRHMVYRLHVWHRGEVRKISHIESQHITVCDLHPARDYVLQVSCIPKPLGYEKPQGHYSEFASIVQKTHEDVPSGVPGVTDGSFRYHDCHLSSQCMVTLYWRSMPEEVANGEITHYMITQTDTQSGDIQSFQVNGSERTFNIGVLKDQEYLIQLKASTRVGYSLKSASLLIQPYEYRLPFPTNFLVEAHDNLLDMSWTLPRKTDNTPKGRHMGYTLYYCNGSKFTHSCTGEMTVVPVKDQSFQLEVVNDPHDNKLMGISFQMEIANQRISSGIMWNHCVYRANQRPPRLSDVQLSPVQPDDSLRVEWQPLDCSKYPVYISQYVITYCPANSQQGCAGPSVNVTARNTEESHIIKDLTAGVSYRVTMFAMSKAGAGPESEALIMEVKNSDLKTGPIVGVVFACLFGVLFLVIIFIILCRKVKKIKKGFYMDVDIPSLPPLREADPLQDIQHHYPGRPLPQPPTTGPDDGYSSADTDPTFDPTRYEPVSSKTRVKTGNEAYKRNVSMSSESALLLYMEENNHHMDDNKKCNPYQVTQLSTIHSTGSLTADEGHKRSRPQARTKGVNGRGVDEQDTSVESYLKVDNSDSTCHSGSSDMIFQDATLPVQHRQQAQIGFALMRNSISDPPPPAPPPTRHDIPLEDVHRPPSHISYVTDVSAFARQLTDLDSTLPASEPPQYSKIGSDGSLSPPPITGYLRHSHMMSPEPPSPPAMTSTPHGDHPSVRPLSEYMKHLPLSYYQEPHSDQEFGGPTTEL